MVFYCQAKEDQSGEILEPRPIANISVSGLELEVKLNLWLTRGCHIVNFSPWRCLSACSYGVVPISSICPQGIAA